MDIPVAIMAYAVVDVPSVGGGASRDRRYVQIGHAIMRDDGCAVVFLDALPVSGEILLCPGTQAGPEWPSHKETP